MWFYLIIILLIWNLSTLFIQNQQPSQLSLPYSDLAARLWRPRTDAGAQG
jgi:hypothetical protein